MNHKPDFEKKLRKFSVVKACPRCNQLTLAFSNGKICCTNCGYEEKVQAIR